MNIEWKSFVLSLATELFGIMVLQWICAYGKRESLSYKELLCLRQSRYQSLIKWKIPEIVTVLPILLQVFLVIFFAGLIDFLNLSYPNLAIVVGVFIGLTLLFVVVTTMLPAFRLFTSPKEGIPDVLCAYQSLQSWLFVKFFHIVINIIFRNAPLTLMRQDYLYLNSKTGRNVIEHFGAAYQLFKSLSIEEEWKVVDQLAEDTYIPLWPPVNITPGRMSNVVKEKPGFMRDLFACNYSTSFVQRSKTPIR
ncbi:hypothetical protein CVT24_012962 [Panaeolus cyanescens]|uniref:DUF6535 domain-containing protein n=1 Tax=Panaeolus cyanescens TaxID=181874 RepID=A0A409WL28_9AGAR|nr:hypothetical protein CVT24_012962 [Panaeolus cyanescens]